jgi:hypothetical protein
MTRQLALIETPAAAWRLDDTTRAIGRRGLEEARSALRAARTRAAVRDGLDSADHHSERGADAA